MSAPTGVDFIKILQSANPKSAKRHSRLDCLFALFGSAFVKALRKQVGQIDPGVNFINTLQAAFTRSNPGWSKKTYDFFWHFWNLHA